MSEIYLLNACKLDREVNLFDFFLESIALRIKILINVTLSLIINNSCLFTSKLNTPIAVNIAIFLKTAFFIEHPWWLLLNSNLIVTTQILTKQKKVQKLNPFWRGGGGGLNFLLERGDKLEKVGSCHFFYYFTVQSHLLCVGKSKVPFITFRIFSLLS